MNTLKTRLIELGSENRRWAGLLFFVLFAGILGLTARTSYLDRPSRVVSDERHYLKDGIAYAGFIENRDWAGLVAYRGHYEHPPLVRILWGGGIAAAHGLDLAVTDLVVARWTSVLAGLGLVLLATIVNPFAGIFLAIHSVESLFTARAYLEAVPALTSAIAVISYVRYRKTKYVRWLYLAALALGITAASKYIYLTAGIALAPFLLWDHRRQPLRLVIFGVVMLGTFVLFNPHMWINPIQNMSDSIRYHLSFQNKPRVIRFGRQWWYPIAYTALGSGPVMPEYKLSFNFVIIVLGFLGLPQLWRVNRVYFAWFVCSLLFLMIWGTKWNQYVLTFLTPLCLSAGLLVSGVLGWTRTRVAVFKSQRFANRSRER